MAPLALPAGTRTYHQHNGVPKVAIIIIFTVAFIFSLTLLLPKSGGSEYSDKYYSRSRSEEEGLTVKEVKGVIGSKPPACVNKCMKCRPCMATVVVPNHKMRRNKAFKLVTSHDHDDDSYYLLSWRCTCGNKLFHP